MIRTENLTKHYDGVTAVEDLNIHVQKGEIYGFLGPNGAGKTTTIMMILGLVKPSAGRVELFGQPMEENYFLIKRRLGVLSEFQYLYEDMTGYEYIKFFADLYKVENRKRIDELLEMVGLYDRKDQLIAGYSKGMRQRLSWVRCLLHDPEILILDEPVTGLDPHGIVEMRDLIMEQHAAGKTLFISSHILSEIEKTCDRVGIMNRGQLLAEDTMESIKKRITNEVELNLELEEVSDAIVSSLEDLEFVNNVSREDGKRLVIKTTTEADYRARISRTISDNGGVVLEMRTREMSLEDAFVTITKDNISLLTKGGQT